MTGGIKKTEIVEADLGQLADEIHKVGTELELLLTILGKKPPKNEGLGGIKKDTEELTFAEKELQKQHQELWRVTAKLEQFQTDYNKDIIKTRVEINNQTTAAKQQVVINNSLEGSYDKLNATLNQTIREYKALSQADRENIAIGGEMIKTIQAQDAQLKQLDATMGRSQRNVGNYKSGFNGLNFSIMQVGRELPSLAYGVNIFAAAISNNIPMVTDELKRAREEIVRATKAGEQSVPIWKQVAGAIFSWQTALVVGLTLFTMYGKEIIGFIGGLFKTTEAINKAKLAQEAYNKIRLEGIGSAQSELTRLELLYGALKNVNTSANDRNKILKELQDKYPDYFGSLDTETIKVGGAEKAYYRLKNAIIESAEARVFAEQIGKNKKEILDLDQQITDLEVQRAQIRKDNPDAGGDYLFGSLVDPFSKINKSIQETIDKRSDLEKQNEKLRESIKITGLVQDFGVSKGGKDGNKVKAAKEEAAELIDINFLLAKIKRDQEIEAQKEASEETKRIIKAATDEQKAFTDETIANSVAQADEQKLSAQEFAIEKIRAAKNEKDEIEKIQHELTLFMIDQDIAAQQRILDTAGLEADAYANASDRIRRLRLQRGEEDIQFTQQTEEQKKQIRNETMQATAELLSQGLAFSQQIYSAQATRAQEAYDAEMNAAGDSLEYQTLAKRKFEAEDKKIKQRQAIASKLQAVLDAGLALALAIATTWKNPFLAALNIGAATIGLGMALATPIPQFAEGVEDFEGGLAVLGDGTGSKRGRELVTEPSGKKWLSSDRPSLYNLVSGSDVTPADEVQKQLANMAFNQVREVVDLSKTNEHLASMDKQMKNKSERYTDAKGRTVVKRGSLVSTL